MRRITMLSLAIAGMFILTSAAVVRANWYHESESSGENTSEMTSPSSEPGVEAPEVGTYEYQQALETGNLPSAGEPGVSLDRSSGAGEEIQTLESGGFEYRVGIDTGP